MWKQGVLLKQEADAALLRCQGHAAGGVEPNLFAERDVPGVGPFEAGQGHKIVVLPQPEGPKSTVMPGPAAGTFNWPWIVGPPVKRFSKSAQSAGHSGIVRRDRLYVRHNAVKAKINNTVALCAADV